MSTGNDKSNILEGSKATLGDSNASDQAKQHSKQIVDSINSEGGKIMGGHEATVNSQSTSNEAKEHSKKILEESGAK